MDNYSLVVLAVFIISFVVCLIIANRMVKKRNMLAKRCVIGRDSPETIDSLTRVAAEVLSRAVVSNEDDITIEITQKNDEIAKVKVENEKTIVILRKDGEKDVINKGFSEKGATFYLGLTLWAFTVVITIFGSLMIYGLLHAS